jgi:micrococcal nuclease
VLELRALAAEVGGDVVGGCVEHERFDAATGDRLQRTHGGLLVWRDETRTAAFTDGHRTWLRGPYGLQQRLRRQRFDWELTTTDLGAPVLLSVEREAARVASAIDGATLALEVPDGTENVSLLGIESPELSAGGGPSCMAERAAAQLDALAPAGAPVRLETDPGLEPRGDEEHRQRYVWLGDGRLLNREMVRRGLAVTVDDGGRSRFGLLLRAAERQARADGQGLWAPAGCQPGPDPPTAGRVGERPA